MRLWETDEQGVKMKDSWHVGQHRLAAHMCLAAAIYRPDEPQNTASQHNVALIDSTISLDIHNL